MNNNEVYGILDLLDLETDQIHDQIFTFKDLLSRNLVRLDSSDSGVQFVSIQITKLQNNSTMIKFKDVSTNIMYKKEKSHNELLNLINATVSHEMRNPLNSINAQNIENCALY